MTNGRWFVFYVLMVLLSYFFSGNAYAMLQYESNKLQIVMTPDGFPIIWFNEKKYGQDFIVLQSSSILHSCFSYDNQTEDDVFDKTLCDQQAGIDGARWYKLSYVEGVGEIRVYYDANGNIVGTQQVTQFKQARQNFGNFVDNSSFASAMDQMVVGTIAGSFDVNQSGSANYAIDIVTPPGIAGMKPDLSISYSSTTGNGVLGVGWRLNGLSSIGRCGKTLAVDGVSSPVVYNEQVFCIDGQRLLPNTAGGNEYRTEIESFNRVTASDATASPVSFSVLSKSGLTSTYTKIHNTSKTRIWPLTRIEDTSGNRIEFLYFVDDASGEYQIREIRYAFSGGQYNASVSFEYDGLDNANWRKDKLSGWSAGLPTATMLRLRSIKTFVDGGNLVRDYRFKYEQDSQSGSSLLSAIKLCNGKNECYKESRFGWQLASADIGNRINTGYCSNANTDCDLTEANGYLYYPDINGDGRSDLCYIKDSVGLVCRTSNGAGGFNPEITTGACRQIIGYGDTVLEDGGCYSKIKVPNDSDTGGYSVHIFDGRSTIRFMDVNADGRDDLVYRATSGIQVIYSTVNGFSSRVNTGIYSWVSPAVDTWPTGNYDITIDASSYQTIYLADLNGNGLPELCYRSKTGIDCHLNTGVYGNPWSTSVGFHTDACADNSLILGVCRDADNHGTIRFVDLNSDSRQDLVYRGDSGMRVWYSTSSLNSLSMVYDETAFDVPASYFYLFGGGFIYSSLCKNDSYIYIGYAYNISSNQLSTCNQATWKRLYYPDVNGDGYTDFCYIASQGLHCWLNAGQVAETRSSPAATTQFADVIITNICSVANTADGGCNSEDNWSTLQFVDLNSDGKADISYRGDSGIQQWLSTGDGFIYYQSLDICANGSPYHGGCDSYANNYTQISNYADFNGDSKMDFVYRGNEGVQVWIDFSYKTNLITSITNGMGENIAIDYSRLSDGSVYTADDNDPALNRKIYPYKTLRTPMSVVKSYSRSDGLGGRLSTQYFYKNLKMHMQGRGLIGFAEVRSLDSKSVLTRTTYEQYFPSAGMPVETYTIAGFSGAISDLSLQGSLVNYSRNEYGSIPSDKGRVFPYAAKTIDRAWEYTQTPYQVINPDAAGWVSEIETDTVYDNAGNVATITHTTRQDAGATAFVTTTQNTYDGAGFSLIDGRLQTAIVTKTEADGTQQSKKSAFSYYPNGLLQSETIEPDDLEAWQTTTYQYDQYGNKTVTTVTAANQTPRTTTTQYDPTARFAAVITNALGHGEKRIYDSGIGMLLEQTGPYSTDGTGLSELEAVITRYQYDGFGREIEKTVIDQTGQHPDQVSVTQRELCSEVLTCYSPVAYYRVVKTVAGIDAASITEMDFLGREVLSASTGFDDIVRLVQTEYDRYGRVSRKSRPYRSDMTPSDWTVMQYDVLDRLIRTTQPALDGDGLLNGQIVDAVSTISYQGLATVTQQQVIRNGIVSMQTKTERKDALGRLVSVTDNNGQTIRYSYRYQNNLAVKTVTDPKGGVITTTTDLRGNKISMDDPDMGYWTYQYNGFGELVLQTDSRGTTTAMQYDPLGRVTQKTTTTYVPDTSTGQPTTQVQTTRTDKWIYDTLYPGKLTSVTGGGVSKNYQYDSLGRQIAVTTLTNGFSETLSRTFDDWGRVAQQTYPGGFSTRNLYKLNGHLESVINANNPARVYWQATSVDEEGNVTAYTLGNGLQVTRMFRLGHLISQGDVKNITRDRNYQYDSLGNLIQRDVVAPPSVPEGGWITETFDYDGLNRLTSSSLSGGMLNRIEAYSYDELGNITSKPGVGVYQYDAGNARYKRLLNINGPDGVRSFTYDANGNMLANGSMRFTWAGNNKIRVIYDTSQPGVYEIYNYDADGNRVWNYKLGGGKSVSMLTLLPAANMGMHYEQTKVYNNGWQLTHKYYIYVGGSMVAMEKAGAETGTEYYVKDHLGSITTVLDQNLNIISERSFDAFGQNRDINWTAAYGYAPPSSLFASATSRGYTGHEHIASFGLINMNGRLYDPVIGRFISADPFVQFADNLQSYNRYAYVLNNPLNATDPSGYFSLRNLIKTIAMVGIAVYTGAWASLVYGGVTGAVIGGAISGFVSGLISGGGINAAFRGGVMGAISGGMFGGIHNVAEELVFTRITLHGLAGGLMSEMQGGSFRSGFLSAGFTQSLSGKIGLINQGVRGIDAARTFAAAVIGGTASVLGGGKFANGALTGAFSRMFNDDNYDPRGDLGDGHLSPAEALRKALSRRSADGLLVEGLKGASGQMSEYLGNNNQSCINVCAISALLGEPGDQVYKSMDHVTTVLDVVREYPNPESGMSAGLKALSRQVDLMKYGYNAANITTRFKACIQNQCVAYTP